MSPYFCGVLRVGKAELVVSWMLAFAGMTGTWLSANAGERHQFFWIQSMRKHHDWGGGKALPI